MRQLFNYQCLLGLFFLFVTSFKAVGLKTKLWEMGWACGAPTPPPWAWIPTNSSHEAVPRGAHPAHLHGPEVLGDLSASTQRAFEGDSER